MEEVVIRLSKDDEADKERFLFKVGDHVREKTSPNTGIIREGTFKGPARGAGPYSVKYDIELDDKVTFIRDVPELELEKL